MRRLLLIPFLLTLLASCSYAGKGAAVAVIDVDSVNLGTVSYRLPRVVNYNLHIENRGDANLKIQDFRVDCDCTKAKADTTVIAPGERTTVHVSIEFALQRSAPFAKKLGIYTNDTVHNPLMVTFYGQQDYQQEVSTNPRYKKHAYEE